MVVDETRRLIGLASWMKKFFSIDLGEAEILDSVEIDFEFPPFHHEFYNSCELLEDDSTLLDGKKLAL